MEIDDLKGTYQNKQCTYKEPESQIAKAKLKGVVYN